MDLIYTDKELNDVAALTCAYALDYAYGSDENDFELSVSKDNDVIESGNYFYIDNEGIGGIVDAKRVDTGENKVYYTGRTLEGILEGCVIQPSTGASYKVVSGDAHTVIQQLINEAGLSSVFTVSPLNSVYVEYQFRYANLYTGILDMLFSYGYCLHIDNTMSSAMNTVFMLEARPIVDYSKDEEWDSSQIKLKIKSYDAQPNHLICLGSGNLANRNVIHLFCDEAGIVQQYAYTDNPLKDADYILDESKKAVRGINEISVVYDYPNIETLINYVKLESKPDDWNEQTNFYSKENNAYKKLEMLPVPTYNLLNVAPNDWQNKYKNYYYVVDGSYTSIPEQNQYNYSKQSSKPADWENAWENYYYYVSDGTSSSYEKVPSDKEEYFVEQTMEPSDWQSNYANYYKLNRGDAYNPVELEDKEIETPYILPKEYTINGYYQPSTKYDGEYDLVSTAPVVQLQRLKFMNSHGEYYVKNLRGWYMPLNSLFPRSEMITKEEQSRIFIDFGIDADNAWFVTSIPEKPDVDVVYSVKGMDIIQITHEMVVPTWTSETYYTRYERDIAPAWKANYYYTLTITHNAPAFTLGTYYELINELRPNEFKPNTYYRMYEDHFNKLVEAGIKKLSELRQNDSVEVTLEGDREYKIGDKIGVTDQDTNTDKVMRIIKKIITIEDFEKTINYTLQEVG